MATIARMSRTRVAQIAQSRAISTTAARAAAINFTPLVGKVANDADKLRLLGLQKGHESAKGELNKVAASSEAIDWAYFNGAIGQDDVVAEIKSAFDSVKLPDAKDTTLVEHPAWDADEFDKLALALQGENAEIASKSAKLTAYLGYMDNLPAVTEMTVDDVLSKDATLDEKIHRELNSLELHNVVIPDQRLVSHVPELDPRKKLDPLFPDSDLVEKINAPARALAGTVLADAGMSAAIAQAFPQEADAAAFGEAVEGLLCQAPLADCEVAEPELDFSGCGDTLATVFDLKFSDVSEEARAPVIAAFEAIVSASTAGAAVEEAAAKAAATDAAASDILASAPKAANAAVFAEANSAEWHKFTAKLLNVQSGAADLLAAAGDSEAEISAMLDAFTSSPSADGARKLAAAYSLACSDVESTEGMVTLIEAHVIQGALFTDSALKAKMAAVFASEAEQKAAYAAWWPEASPSAMIAPFDNVSAAASDDTAFAKTQSIVSQHMLSIA